MEPVVTVKNIKLGEGLPKICVPLVDADIESLRVSAAALKKLPCDLIEWRGDHFAAVLDEKERNAALKMLQETLPEKPLLFTMRTDREGGAMSIKDEDYLRLNLSVIDSGLADLVDVELSRGEAVMGTLVGAAHQKNRKIVGSCHNFAATPEQGEIVKTLCQMQTLGCDIAKYAVMPQSEEDVLTLLAATLEMKRHHSDTPVITMSMGPIGSVSRVCGGVFGSCLTFGTAGSASAPGQLPAGELRRMLELLNG